MSYENIRDKLLQGDPERKFPLWKSAATGATSGAVAQFLASPADLVKVQIQMEGKRRLLGLEPRFVNFLFAFHESTTIYNEPEQNRLIHVFDWIKVNARLIRR